MWFFIIIMPLLVGTTQHITYVDYESHKACVVARVRAIKIIDSVKVKNRKIPYYIVTSCKKVGIRLIGG